MQLDDCASELEVGFQVLFVLVSMWYAWVECMGYVYSGCVMCEVNEVLWKVVEAQTTTKVTG